MTILCRDCADETCEHIGSVHLGCEHFQKIDEATESTSHEVELSALVRCSWVKEFPQEAGLYWFHGYRYGKVTCGQKANPETMLVKVRKITNGFMYVAEGQFMSENEVEEPHFLPVILPVLPNI